MYLLEKGLLIAFTVFCIYCYNGCFAGFLLNGRLNESTFGVEVPDQNYAQTDTSPQLNGPDQVLRTTDYRTSKVDGLVRLKQITPTLTRTISVPGLMTNAFRSYRDKVALLSLTPDNKWESINYITYEAKVELVANAFINLGLERKEGVAILGFNSPEWVISYLAAIYAGGIAAPISTTYSIDALYECLKISRARIIIVEDYLQLKKVLEVKGRLSGMIKIIQYNGQPTVDDVISWTRLLEIGKEKKYGALDNILKTMGVNECCTLVFKSGTNGTPVAVMLSQDNLTFDANMIATSLVLNRDGTEKIISYLPLSHIAAQISDIHIAILTGARVYFAPKSVLEYPDTLITTLKAVEPTIFMGVPRVWENLKYELIQEEEKVNIVASTANSFARKLKVNQRGGQKNLMWKSLRNNLKFMLLDPVKNSIGLKHTKVYIAVAAPTPLEIKEYFKTVNIHLTEAFGMSECSGANSLTVPASKYTDVDGGVGTPLSGTISQLNKLDPNMVGQLEIYGRHVFMGYLGLQELTEKTITSKGELLTGVLATKDMSNFITIKGRYIELIITSGGEAVPPVYIEENVKAELSYIGEVFLVGEKRPYLSILISFKCKVNSGTTEPTNDLTPEVTAWLSSLGCICTKMSEVQEKITDNLNRVIQGVIDRANTKAMSDEHTIKKFKFVSADLPLPTGQSKFTRKMKRDVANEHYTKLIQSIYAYV